MIDWPSLAFNFLWILGLSCALSVFGWAYYQSQARQTSLRQAFRGKGIELILYTSGILFCGGLAGSTQPGLERWVWIALAILWAFQLGAAVLNLRKSKGVSAES